jgi:YHS domain-containing protein
MSKDPVCEMMVDEREASEKSLSTDLGGQTFYFCSAECKKTFDEDPKKYAPLIRWPEDWKSEETEQPLT